ncbi:hypothetical protein ACSU64_06140 [Bacillaceae bacterium C204]|uniref:hypothetical protein n=1 Tax=Neobacillus sp. 204 TaxID=3383351 RepID=UPI00397E49B5
MWWFTYTALSINLLVIWFMPKRLTLKEIYVTWFIIAMINLSSDFVLCLYFKLYELDGSGIQLRVHLLEWTLGASYGIIFLNFMPKKVHKFILYLTVWVAYSLFFEAVLVHLKYVNFTGWKLLYSAPYYICAFLFLRWHIHFIRTN